MYEISRFLAATTPKVKKARKPAKPAAKVGKKVTAYPGGSGEIVAKHETLKNYYWITLDGDPQKGRKHYYHRDAFNVTD